MSYADWGDLVGRYPQLEKLGGSVEVNSVHLHGAERELDSRLAPYYTTPFSSNNYTATDLTIELAFIRYYEAVKPDWAEKKIERTSMRIDALIEGKATMVTNSGGTILPANASGGAIYSNTKDYHPTFGLGDIENMQVSSAQLLDEEDARG